MEPCLTVIKSKLFHILGGIQKAGGNPRLYGDCTGLSGDLDKAGITSEEREASIRIADLVIKAESVAK